MDVNVNVQHSIEMNALFNKQGITSAHIDGTTEKKTRDKIIRDFTNDYEASLSLQELITGATTIVEPGNDHKELDENHYVINLEDENSVNAIWDEDYKEVNMVFICCEMPCKFIRLFSLCVFCYIIIKTTFYICVCLPTSLLIPKVRP